MAKPISLKTAQLIKGHKYILQKLAKSSPKNRRKILSNAPNDLYRVFHQIFKLLADDKIQLNKGHEAKIKKHRHFIRSASKLNTKTIKAKLIGQHGGSIPKVLTAILPILGTVIKAIL